MSDIVVDIGAGHSLNFLSAKLNHEKILLIILRK